MRRYQHNDNLMWSQMVVFLLPVFEGFCFWDFFNYLHAVWCGITQHIECFWHNTDAVLGQRLLYCPSFKRMLGQHLLSGSYPANTKHVYNISTTTAQRLRRWSNIVQMLYKCVVFTAMSVFRDIRRASWEGAILPFILCLRLWVKPGGAASAFSCFNHPTANVLPFNYLWIVFFVGFELSFVCVSVSAPNTFVKFYRI